MKSRSGISITREKIKFTGDEPAHVLKKLAEIQVIQLIAFGESHWYQNPHRKLLMDSIGIFADSGFTTLALELETKYQKVIDRYLNSEFDFESLQSHLLPAADSIFNREERPCPYYFGAIEKAREQGLEIIVVDKVRDDKLWNQKEYGDYRRDKFMADRLKVLFDDEAKQRRVIFFGGNNHLYRRSQKESDLSMIESLANRGLKTVSIGGVLFSRRNVGGLTFESLYPLTDSLEGSKIVKTDYPGMDIFLGKDRRCAWGGCSSEMTGGCPGIKFNLCQSITEDEIYADYWDYLVFYEAGWNGAEIVN